MISFCFSLCWTHNSLSVSYMLSTLTQRVFHGKNPKLECFKQRVKYSMKSSGAADDFDDAHRERSGSGKPVGKGMGSSIPPPVGKKNNRRPPMGSPPSRFRRPASLQYGGGLSAMAWAFSQGRLSDRVCTRREDARRKSTGSSFSHSTVLALAL